MMPQATSAPASAEDSIAIEKTEDGARLHLEDVSGTELAALIVMVVGLGIWALVILRRLRAGRS